MEILETKLDELRVAAKRTACLTLMERIRNECLGLDADQWSCTTGKIFGDYLRELKEEENRLPK